MRPPNLSKPKTKPLALPPPEPTPKVVSRPYDPERLKELCKPKQV